MDIKTYTLKKQWEWLKSELPGIRLQEGKEILGCSESEIIHIEFDLMIIETDLKGLECISEPIGYSNMYR